MIPDAAPTNAAPTNAAPTDAAPIEVIPTDAGRSQLLQRLNRVIGGPVSVRHHAAAVRPTMRTRTPVVGRHATHPSLLTLNGLGSKGVLYAPALSADILRLLNGEPPRHAWAALRSPRETAGEKRPPLTAVAQERVRRVVRPGDTVVDATVGNGFDTVALAEMVGPDGIVIGYDVQQRALDATAARLEFVGRTNVRLHHGSHERIADLPSASAAAVMFNLGFLPRGDHAVVTRPESTAAALKAALHAVRPGGIVSVLCYRGHDGGPEEFAAVQTLLAARPELSVDTIESTPPRDTAPVLLIVRLPAKS